MPPSPLGQIGDINAYFGGMLEAAGVPRAQLDPALARMDQRQAEVNLWTRAMEGARGALDELVAMGLPCAVVSNSDGRAEKQLRDCDMLRGLAFVVDSHQVGIEKPDPGIWQFALRAYPGLPSAPDKVLHLGDTFATDVLGAQRLGFRAALIDPYSHYEGRHPTIPRVTSVVEVARAIVRSTSPRRPKP